MRLTTCLPKDELEKRRMYVYAALARGHVVEFTNSVTGCRKYIDRWDEDSDGDLTACRVDGGRSPFLAWDAVEYTIEELEQLPETGEG
jgi:hypothetical protein